MDNLSILIKALLDPESTQDIESQIKNLQSLFDKSPLKVKLDVDNSEFKAFSDTLQKLSASINKSFDFNSGIVNVDKITQKFEQVAGQSEKMTKEIIKFKNQLGQTVSITDDIKESIDEAGKVIREVTKSRKTIIDDNKGNIYKQLKDNINQIYQIENKLLTAGENETVELQKQLSLLKDKRQALLATKANGGYDDDLENIKLTQHELQKIAEYRTNIAKLKDKENIKQQTAYEKSLQYEQQVRLSIEQTTQKEKQKTEELQKQLELYKLRMLGGNGFTGELDIFAEKQKGKYNEDALKKIREDVEALNIQTPDLSNKMKKLTIEFSSLKQQASQSGNVVTRAFDNMFKFLRFYIAGSFLVNFVNVFRDGISYIKEFDDALVSLTKVVDLSDSQLRNMANTAVELGKQLGQSSASIMEGMAEWGRVTKDTDEIIELTKAATIASNVTTLSVAEASKALTTAMITFKVEAKDAMTLVDQWNEIQNNFRISAEDLADAIGKVGSVAQQSSTPLQSIEGYITAMVSALGISGDEAGTALRSVISRVYRIGEDGAEDAGKSEEFLNRIGVAVRDATGQFRSFSDILDDTAKKYKTLKNTEQIALAQQLAGTMHYSKLIGLLENYNIALEATAKAYDSQNSAMIENEKYLSSISGKIQIFKTSWEDFWGKTIDSSVMKGLVDFGTVLVNILDSGLSRFILTNALLTTGIYGAVKAFEALKKMILATDIVTKGLWKTLSASPFFWISAAIAGIQGIVTLVDALTVSIKEQRERVEEAKQAYEDTKTEIQSLNSELETIQQRIDELNSKDKLNIVEKNELKELQLTNKELQFRIDLLKEEEKLKAEQLANEQLKLYNKTYGRYTPSEDIVEYRFQNNYMSAEKDDISGLIAAYQLLAKRKEEAISSGNETQVKSFSDAMNKIKQSLNSSAQELLNFKKVFESTDVSSPEIEEALNEITTSLDLISTVIFPELNRSKFPIPTSEEISNVKQYSDRLKEIADTVKDSESSLKNLNQAIQDNGKLSADQVLELINLYPDLADKVELTTDGFRIQTEALEALRKQQIKTVLDVIDAQIEEVQNQQKATQSKLRNYNLEIEKIEDIIKAKKRLAELAHKEAVAYANASSGAETNEFLREKRYSHAYNEYLAKSGYTELSVYEQALVDLEKLKQTKDTYENILNNIGKSSSSKSSRRKEYTPLSELSVLKTLYDDEVISLDTYIQRLISLERQKYSQYAKMSAKELEDALKGRNEEIAKEVEEYLSIHSLIKDLQLEQIELSFGVYDKAIKDLDASLSLLGNINTVEEKAKEAEILGKKFKLAEEQLKKLEQQLTDPSLTYAMRELLQDKKVKLELDIVSFMDRIEEVQRELLETEKEITLLEIEANYKKKLADAEKAIYGSTQDAYEDTANSRIESLQNQIDLLEKQNDELEEQQTRQEKLLNIEKQKQLLANLQNEKTVRVYKAGEGFVWEVDPKKVKDAQDKLAELQEDYADWESELKRKKQIRALQEEIEYQRKQLDEKRKAYEAQRKLLEEAQKKEEDQVKVHYNDLQALVEDSLEQLKNKYGDQWDEILKILQQKLADAQRLQQQLLLNAETVTVAASSSTAKSTATYFSGVDYSQVLNKMQEVGEIDKKVWNELVDSRNAKIDDMDISREEKEKLKNQYKKYDTGGLFPSNSIGINLSGKPEYVLNPDQTKAWLKFVDYLPNIIKKFDFLSSLNFNLPSFNIPALTSSRSTIQEFHIGKLEFPNVRDGQDVVETLRQFPRFIRMEG